MPARKTVCDYQFLATRRGFVWLGPFPRNSKAPTTWRCQNGHEFPACYNNVDQGMRCGFCTRAETARKQRHSKAAYHSLAEQRGIFWLGPPVNSAHEPTVWECALGHRWPARYNAIQQGTGCGKCSHERRAARVRRQPAEYHHLAASRGFTWLGPVVASGKTKTEWQCENGHRWFSTFNWIQQRKKGCRQCAGLAPLTAANFRALADRRGFVWTGPNCVNSRTKTSWRCSHSHEWQAIYTSINGGSGCPDCSGNIAKTIEEFARVAEKRGFLWLGPVVPNSKTKTEWQCPQGHRWFAPFNAIDQGNGCWACSGLMPKTPADYVALAAERDLRWMGQEVGNTGEKTGWLCPNGHSFSSSYNTVGAGHGCPSCLDMINGAMVSKNQRLLCEMVGGELNGERLGRFVIDVTKRIDGIKIAIEYDTWFIHGPSNASDLRKDRALLVAGWRVLRIRTNTKLPSLVELENAIERLVAGELWVDIELDDWGIGRVAPWRSEYVEPDR